MTAEEFLDQTETAAPTAEAFLDQPPAMSAEDFLDAEPQSYAKATGNSLAQSAVKGIGHALQGLAEIVRSSPPISSSEFDTPASVERYQQWYDEVASKSAAERLKMVQQDPVYQKGKELVDIAPETYPVDQERQHQLGPRAGEMVGSLLPLVASGPAAPVTIGLESLGSHLDTDFQKFKAEGLSEDEAAQKTVERGLASGLTQATIFAALPPVLRKAGQKYLVDKFGGGVGKFVAGRAAQALEGGAIGATSAAGENIVSDRPLGENVLPSAGAMAILQTITAWPKGAARPRNLEADSLEMELGGTPGPTIIPPSRQLRKPAIVTPPPEPVQTPRRAPQTLDEIDMFLRDEAPVLPPEMLVRPVPKETPLSLSRRAVQENIDAMASLRQMKELDAAVEQVRQEILQREAAAPIPAPERPEVLAGQLQLVAEGKTPAMLITPGAELKAEVPDHLRRVNTPDGEFVFDPTQTSAEEIAQRVADNSYGQLLGFGSESKPANGEAVLQTSDAKGIPLKEEVVSRETLPAALDAAQKIVPENGRVELKSAEDVLKQRLVPVEVSPAKVKAARTRLGRRSTGAEKRLAVEEEARRELFERNAFAPRPNTEPMPVPQLFQGETVKFEGHPMRLVEFTFDEAGRPDGAILEGAYGRQAVGADQVLHIDKGSWRASMESQFSLDENRGGRNVPKDATRYTESQIDDAIERIKGPLADDYGPGAMAERVRGLRRAEPNLRDADLGKSIGISSETREAFEKTFGVKIVFVYSPEGKLFSGYRDSRFPGLLFIDVRTRKPALTIAGHELLHEIRGQSPRLYSALDERLTALMDDFPAYRRQLDQLYKEGGLKPLSEPRAREELIADFFAEQMGEPTFWEKLQKSDASLFERLATATLEFLKTIRRKIEELVSQAGFKSSHYFSEVTKAQDIVVAALKAYTQRLKESGGNPEEMRSVSFALDERPTSDRDGLSMRAAKLMADEQLSSKVRDAIDARYQRRTNEGDKAIAQQLIAESGGATPAAMNWVNGRFRGEPESVQTILGIEIQKQLAGMERRLRGTNPHGADAIVSLQQRLAAADIQRATDVAQGLQAFRVHYANWSPSAWIKDFRDTVGKVASRRVERVSGAKVEESPTGVAQGIAEAIADELQVSNPKVAQTIREQFGRKAEPGKRHPDPKTAKKIDEFYKREVAKFRKKHKIPEFDETTERDILRRANDLQRLPEDSVQRREAAQQLQNHLRKLKGFNLGELAMDFWYANILSGASTHVKNMLGNAVNLTGEAGIQMLRNPTAIPQIIEALGRSLPLGAREAASVLRTGIESHGRHGNKFDSPPGALENVTSPVMGKILLPWKLVGRALRAEDAVFFHAMQEMRASVLARQQARTEGFPIYSTRLTNRVREIMGWTAEAKTKAEAQAKAEGLTGDIAARRVNELIEQQRPPLLMENARDYAFLGTFNNDPYGVLGAATRYWGGFAEQVPAAKLVVPFTRIVANVANSSLNWTPVGLWRAARAQGFKLLVGRESETGQLFGKKVTDPGAIGDQYARATIGTLALGALAMASSQYLFDENPQFMVTATGPNNKDQRELLQASGWIPYSVKIGEHYYSYADKPLAIGLSIVGHYLDAMRYRKLGQQDALNRAAFALGSSADVILNSSWLQGLSSIFSQANRDSVKTPLKGIPSQAIKTLSSFVVPNALRQMDQLFDPTKYTADEVREMVMRETPFVRRENKPDLNVFGEPVHAPISKIFYSKVEGDVLIKTLAGRRIWPSVIVAGDLNADEVYAVTQARGARLRMRLMQNYADIAARPRAEAQEIVSRISSEVTRETIDELGLRPALSTRRQARTLTDK